MVTVSASDGSWKEQNSGVFCTFQDLCTDNLCYQWFAYIILFILSILSLCRFVSTSLLTCNNYNDDAAGSIDQLLNKYSEDVAVLSLILLYWCS